MTKEEALEPQVDEGLFLTDDEIHDAWCSFDGENVADQMHNVVKVQDGDRAIAKSQLLKAQQHYEKQRLDAYAEGFEQGKFEERMRHYPIEGGK